MARRVLVERMCFDSEHLGRWCWNTYLNLDLLEKLKKILEAGSRGQPA